MQEAGLGLLVVTNQSGIGRGYFDRPRLEEIHARLIRLLRAEGITLDGIYVCPHLPEEGCECRKPAPGLARQAALEHGFDPRDSFLIGDKLSDIQFGRNIGAVTILTRTGYGAAGELEGGVSPDYVVDDLIGAARIICRRLTEVAANGG
jgi:D-glycero-D-manno-heptose 1,7-bisphosphate phosphatase